MWMASCATEGSGGVAAESSKTDRLVIWRISLAPYGALSEDRRQVAQRDRSRR